MYTCKLCLQYHPIDCTILPKHYLIYNLFGLTKDFSSLQLLVRPIVRSSGNVFCIITGYNLNYSETKYKRKDFKSLNPSLQTYQFGLSSVGSSSLLTEIPLVEYFISIDISSVLNKSIRCDVSYWYIFSLLTCKIVRLAVDGPSLYLHEIGSTFCR